MPLEPKPPGTTMPSQPPSSSSKSASLFSRSSASTHLIFTSILWSQPADFKASKILIEELLKKGIRVECFGYGWKNGRVSFGEMQEIYKISKKECIGKINVKIGNLDSDKKYTLKIVYSHYLQIKKTLDIDIKKTPDDKNIVNEEILSGKNNYEIEIKTSPYYYYKVKPRAGYRVKKKGGSKMEFGDRGAGWDISIWLDNTLIYEEKKGKNPVFYHNISH